MRDTCLIKFIETGAIIKVVFGAYKVWDASGNEYAYSEIEIISDPR